MITIPLQQPVLEMVIYDRIFISNKKLQNEKNKPINTDGILFIFSFIGTKSTYF